MYIDVTCSLSEEKENISKSKIKKKSEFQTLKVKAISQVEAVTEEEESNVEENSFSTYSRKYLMKFFTFRSPANKCVKENCEFCCLSLNFCGSQEQCENSEKTMFIMKIMSH